MKLIKDAWYWVSNPTEGDIFYPVKSIDEDNFWMNNTEMTVASCKDLTFEIAVMPGENNAD